MIPHCFSRSVEFAATAVSVLEVYEGGVCIFEQIAGRILPVTEGGADCKGSCRQTILRKKNS